MTDTGEGYTVSSLERMGDGYGFRKIRRQLGVTASGYETGTHYHQRQEETYFVHRGTVEFRFGDGSRHELGPGGVVRVDPSTHRGMKNIGEEDAIVVAAGGKDGYVGRDGEPVGGDPHGGPPGAGPPGAGPPGAGPPGAGPPGRPSS